MSTNYRPKTCTHYVDRGKKCGAPATHFIDPRDAMFPIWGQCAEHAPLWGMSQPIVKA